MAEKDTSGINTVVIRCNVQRRPATLIPRITVNAGLEQTLDERCRVAPDGGKEVLIDFVLHVFTLQTRDCSTAAESLDECPIILMASEGAQPWERRIPAKDLANMLRM
jgi:hypothetical protein